MDHPPIQMPFGDPGTGNIGEGIGFGFQAIGRDVQRPMPIGSLAIGNQEEEVGSGSVVVGSTDNSNEFGVRSSEAIDYREIRFLVILFLAPNSELKTPNL